MLNRKGPRLIQSGSFFYVSIKIVNPVPPEASVSSPNPADKKLGDGINYFRLALVLMEVKANKGVPTSMFRMDS
jgi:hypothetical protein